MSQQQSANHANSVSVSTPTGPALTVSAPTASTSADPAPTNPALEQCLDWSKVGEPEDVTCNGAVLAIILSLMIDNHRSSRRSNPTPTFTAEMFPTLNAPHDCPNIMNTLRKYSSVDVHRIVSNCLYQHKNVMKLVPLPELDDLPTGLPGDNGPIQNIAVLPLQLMQALSVDGNSRRKFTNMLVDEASENVFSFVHATLSQCNVSSESVHPPPALDDDGGYTYEQNYANWIKLTQLLSRNTSRDAPPSDKAGTARMNDLDNQVIAPFWMSLKELQFIAAITTGNLNMAAKLYNFDSEASSGWWKKFIYCSVDLEPTRDDPECDSDHRKYDISSLGKDIDSLYQNALRIHRSFKENEQELAKCRAIARSHKTRQPQLYESIVKSRDALDSATPNTLSLDGEDGSRNLIQLNLESIDRMTLLLDRMKPELQRAMNSLIRASKSWQERDIWTRIPGRDSDNTFSFNDTDTSMKAMYSSAEWRFVQMPCETGRQYRLQCRLQKQGHTAKPVVDMLLLHPDAVLKVFHEIPVPQQLA